VNNQIKNNKYHIVRTVRKSKWKNSEKEAKSIPPHTIRDLTLSGLGTAMKSGRVKLVKILVLFLLRLIMF